MSPSLGPQSTVLQHPADGAHSCCPPQSPALPSLGQRIKSQFPPVFSHKHLRTGLDPGLLQLQGTMGRYCAPARWVHLGGHPPKSQEEDSGSPRVALGISSMFNYVKRGMGAVPPNHLGGLAET